MQGPQECASEKPSQEFEHSPEQEQAKSAKSQVLDLIQNNLIGQWDTAKYWHAQFHMPQDIHAPGSRHAKEQLAPKEQASPKEFGVRL